jgi:glycosyltransferase involved in cell wall biosynthesis
MKLDHVGVVIPALNEEKAIGKVLADLPAGLGAVIVADNGSGDGTAEAARRAGARVVVEPRRGYGAACLKGISALPADTEVVVFIDGDYSDFPEDLPRLVAPVDEGRADMVIGSRVLGQREAGSLTLTQRFGNWLATWLIGLIWGVRFTDLGPFRAISRRALKRLDMRDRDFGWTVEMQVKAAEMGLSCLEVPVRYRKRIGHSKISGTITGTVRAGVKILSIIFARALNRPRPTQPAPGS